MRQNEFLTTLGKNVKKARKSKGMTLRTLGNMCELDYSSISRLENGARNIHVLTLQMLAEKLEVEITELLPPSISASLPLS